MLNRLPGIVIVTVKGKSPNCVRGGAGTVAAQVVEKAADRPTSRLGAPVRKPLAVGDLFSALLDRLAHLLPRLVPELVGWQVCGSKVGHAELD